MNILSKFESQLQIAEDNGRFYIVGLHNEPYCWYCAEELPHNTSSQPKILKELTPEILRGALTRIDNTESMDFRVYDLRDGGDDGEWYELLEEQERLKAEHYAEHDVPGCTIDNCPTCEEFCRARSQREK